jgi:hypothetical protein
LRLLNRISQGCPRLGCPKCIEFVFPDDSAVTDSRGNVVCLKAGGLKRLLPNLFEGGVDITDVLILKGVELRCADRIAPLSRVLCHLIDVTDDLSVRLGCAFRASLLDDGVALLANSCREDSS